MNIDKIALGTVQFGTEYGIANTSGQVPRSEAHKILNLAHENKIKTLDTAVMYGESENVLGNFGLVDWQVITKIPPVPENIKNIQEWVFHEVEMSLRRLKVKKVYGVLLHDSDQILGKNGDIIRESLCRLKDNQICKKVGLSIYKVNKIKEYIASNDIDIIQAPLNIFDTRLISSEILEELNKKNIEVHARSIFLQGLLLLDQNSIPASFADSAKLFDEWFAWLRNNDIDPVEACLKFVLQYKEIDKVIVGVQNIEQLQKIVSRLRNNSKIQFPDWHSKANKKLINPNQW